MQLKKVLIFLVSVGLVCGATVGGVAVYKNYQTEKTIAGVVSVSEICWEYDGEAETSYGMLTNDAAQEIYLDDSVKVETVYVQKGDTVAVGDALLKYDTSAVESEIQQKEIELEAMNTSLEKAKHELEVLRQTTPVNKERPEVSSFYEEEDTEENSEETETEVVQDELPEKDEKDERIYNYLTEEAVPFNAGEADGSSQDPYIFYVNKDAYAYGSFYNSMRGDEEEEGKCFIIAICQKDENGKMVFGPSQEEVEYVEQIIENEQESLTEEEINEMRAEAMHTNVPQLDSSLSKNEIYINGNSLPTEYDDDRRWYIFSGEEVEEGSLEQWIEEVQEAEEWEEPEGYSAKELAEAITEKEKEVKKIDIEKRTLELTLNSLKEATAEGIVYAKVDGFVKTVGDTESVAYGEVFMVVTEDEGLYVKGTVSELLLERVQPGTVVTANSWETGCTFDAVVTEVSEYPTSENAWGEGNPNVSYYQYTAFIEDSSELKNGEYVDLLIEPEQEDSLYIEKAYVRQEDGKSYVMIKGADGRLKKQYVITGKTIYDGSAIEIKAGLSEEDMIAFPYGEGAVEGAQTTEAEEMYY